MVKIKQWGRIKLWETSCCGIPMYPSAHKSYSLIKALTESNLEDEPSDKLNLEEKPMPEEEEKQEVEEPKEEVSEEIEVKSKRPVTNGVDAEMMTGILTKAIVQAIQEAEAKRGLAASDNTLEDMQKTLKQKSLGELAIMQGLFGEEQAIGSPIGAR